MLSLARYIAGIFFIIIPSLGTIAHAYEVTLSWDPNEEVDLAGYILYVHEDGSGPSYYQVDTVSLDEIAPLNPMYTATELLDNVQYCFVLTAYNSDGYESGFSNEVCIFNGQDETVNLSQDSGNSVVSHTQGESGGGTGGCFISVSGEKPSTPIF
jgi:hypothetical protein